MNGEVAGETSNMLLEVSPRKIGGNWLQFDMSIFFQMGWFNQPTTKEYCNNKYNLDLSPKQDASHHQDDSTLGGPTHS